MELLIMSSSLTIKWLNIIKTEILKKIPSLIYSESKYWAMFKSKITHRNFVYLRPYKTLIQLFTPLPLYFDDQLMEGKTSGGWSVYITLFKIKSESDITKAIDLIIKSYHFDQT